MLLPTLSRPVRLRKALLASSEKGVLEISSDGTLNPDGHDKRVTRVSLAQQFEWFIGDGLVPLFRRKCLLEVPHLAETPVVVLSCSACPSENITVLYSEH